MSRKIHYASGINPALLKWSRETINHSIETVASHLKVSPDAVASWESGQSLPTIRQAMELGKFYHRPWAVFFLAERPNFKILQDFRKVAPSEKEQYSPRLSIFLNEIKEQQEWLSEYCRVYFGEENSYLASWSDLGNPNGLAERIKEVLKIDYSIVLEAPKRFIALKYYQTLVEGQADFFVGKTTAERIEVEEMRGVFLHDKYAPMIFINSTDAVSAQIFTLFHEVAHAFIGKEGVSNFEPLKSGGGFDAVEVFCNKVASEVALPKKLLLDVFSGLSGDSVSRISEVSARFKVSEEMIAIKLSSLGKISEQDLTDVKRKTREALQNKAKPDFGNYHLNRFSRNGLMFTQTVLSAYKSGEIMSLEAAKLLNVRASHINEQMKYAFSS